MQDLKEWLQNVIKQLDQSSLRPTLKLAAAVVLMCCTHHVAISYLHRYEIVNDVDIALLRMMTLQPNGEDYTYLGSLLKEKESK